MITAITQDSKTYYLHTAWASDNKGTGFTLTYDADLYTGTFIDQINSENSDYNAYTWQCSDDEEATTLDSVAADLANLSDRIIGTQDTTDQKLPGVNMATLANTSLSAWTLTNCTAELLGNGIKLTVTADGTVTASFKAVMEMVQTGAYTLSLGCISPAEITASITDAGASLGILASISASENWINYVSTIDAVSDSSSQTIAFSFAATAGQTVSLDYIKFEAGAKSTNWDAAEQALNVADIAINAAATAQSAATTAQSAAETAQTTADSAQNTADNAATSEDAAQLQNQITSNSADIISNASAAQEAVDALSTSTNNKFASLNKYVKVIDGNLVLGETGNEMTLKLENDCISFRQNNTEVAYWTNQKLYVTDGEFLTSLKLGKFAFVPRNNGNLSFRKVVE